MGDCASKVDDDQPENFNILVSFNLDGHSDEPHLIEVNSQTPLRVVIDQLRVKSGSGWLETDGKSIWKLLKTTDGECVLGEEGKKSNRTLAEVGIEPELPGIVTTGNRRSVRLWVTS